MNFKKKQQQKSQNKQTKTVLNVFKMRKENMNTKNYRKLGKLNEPHESLKKKNNIQKNETNSAVNYYNNRILKFTSGVQ
jgi:hypothetical protein